MKQGNNCARGEVNNAYRRTFRWLVLALWTAGLLALAVRPHFPTWYNDLYGLDIGTWAMYKYDVRPEGAPFTREGREFAVPIRIVPANGPEVLIPASSWSRFIWHSGLISSAHPHYNGVVARGLLCHVWADSATLREFPQLSEPGTRLVLEHRVAINRDRNVTYRTEVAGCP